MVITGEVRVLETVGIDVDSEVKVLEIVGMYVDCEVKLLEIVGMYVDPELVLAGLDSEVFVAGAKVKDSGPPDDEVTESVPDGAGAVVLRLNEGGDVVAVVETP